MAQPTRSETRDHATPRRRQLFRRLVALYLRRGFADLTLEQTAALLRCSKSTIYALAASREQLVKAAVVSFFRDAAERVEVRLAAETDPVRRIETYLRAVAEVLEPASAAFMDDIAAFAPARETYELNTAIAARRVRELIDEGVAVGAFRDVHAAFAGEVVSSVMVRIQRREISAAAGLDDAAAYQELADLIVRGIRS